MADFKPLLAAQADFTRLDYTNLWGSAKLDGIRAIVIDGVVMSRSLKPIPNRFVQAKFGNRPELEGYDGELIVGPANAHDVYRVTNSGVMARDGEPDVTFYAFDHVKHADKEYHVRYTHLSPVEGVTLLPQQNLYTHDDILKYESHMLNQGYEGIMLRAFKGPNSLYKYGRATAKSNTLLKVKRFRDDEAVIVDMVERMHNGNEATKNALGHTERGSHKENLVGRGDLGALVVRMGDMEFNIGSGFTDDERLEMWSNKENYLGKLVKFKHFQIGSKDLPRFPIFLGLRDMLDAQVLGSI